MKTTTLYDFTLSANGTQVILADANFYKVLTATGDLQITRDGGATVKPMRAGRGERNVEFQRLVIRDISGAPNSGTILVGDSDFIDDTIVLSSAINVRPEATSGQWNNTAALTANVAVTVFTPASNTSGVILTAASAIDNGLFAAAFVAKSSAPASIGDGEVIAQTTFIVASTGLNTTAIQLTSPTYIQAGLGLYYIGNGAGVSGFLRSARWKNL